MFRYNLKSLLWQEREEIITWLVASLQRSAASHYRTLDSGDLRTRVRELVARLYASTDWRPVQGEGACALVRYIDHLARARIAEGFDLEELQLALSKLEERLWHVVVVYSVAEAQLMALSQLTRIVGAAKDQLARTYLRHQGGVGTPASRREERQELLARGTISAPISEEEDADQG